jgi:starch-binding outer membrane protein, SusD/RagB family
MSISHRLSIGSRTAGFARRAAATCVVASLAACASLTDVKAPSIIQPADVNNPLGAQARYAGAMVQFTSSWISATSASALLTDEWLTSNLPGNGADLDADARRLPEGGVNFSNTPYPSAQIARRNLLDALDAMRTYAPQPTSRVAELLALLGYNELLMSEMICSGVPLTRVLSDGTVQYGSSLTTVQLLTVALAHFDSALAATDSGRILNLARIGRARTLLSLGRFSDAATGLGAVPTSFIYNLQTVSTVSGQTNTLATTTTYTVTDRDGGNGLDYRTANDPRVPTVFLAKGFDGKTDVYRFAKYSSNAVPIPLATGIEARLIEAEAALQANKNDASTTGTGWLGILNTLRGSAIAPAMAPLADPGSFDARVNLLFRERAFWTYLTGHRLGDLRRLVRQYGRAQNTVFPTGVFKDGAPYGNDVNFPIIRTTEAPNPNYKGCLDRNA